MELLFHKVWLPPSRECQMGRSKTSELALVYSAAAAGLLLRAVSRRNAASSSGSSRKILLPAFVLVMLYRLCSMLRRATGEPPEEITSGGAPLQSYVERHCVSFERMGSQHERRRPSRELSLTPISEE